MGITKAKKIYSIAKVGLALGLAIGPACFIVGSVYVAKGKEHKERAYSLVRDEETCRLTNEFNTKKGEFEVLEGKAASGEISTTEYNIAAQEFENIEIEYQNSLKELESTAYLDSIIEAMPQDEEAAKEYEIAKNYNAPSISTLVNVAGAATLVEILASQVIIENLNNDELIIE